MRNHPRISFLVRALPFLLLVGSLSSPLLAAAADRGVVVYVYDGDTLRIAIDGKEEIVRLIGVDAPETHDNDRARRQASRAHISIKEILALGDAATEFTKRQTPRGTPVTVEYGPEKRDEYHRMLGYVYLPNGAMLNELLLSAGYARTLFLSPPPRFSSRFLDAEARAQKQRSGLWGRKGF